LKKHYWRECQFDSEMQQVFKSVSGTFSPAQWWRVPAFAIQFASYLEAERFDDDDDLAKECDAMKMRKCSQMSRSLLLLCMWRKSSTST